MLPSTTFKSRMLIQGTGKFFHDFEPSYWVGLTYLVPPPRPVALRDLRRWADCLAKLVGEHFPLVYAVEGQWRGALHFHVLLATPAAARLTLRQIVTAWPQKVRWAERYDPTRGAAWYLAEKLIWGIMDACPRHASCRRGQGCRAARHHVPALLP